jgi:hypothetical protein
MGELRRQPQFPRNFTCTSRDNDAVQEVTKSAEHADASRNIFDDARLTSTDNESAGRTLGPDLMLKFRVPVLLRS